jgi:CRISPR-associated protein Cmr1
MKKLKYCVRFVTPAFLGNAFQQGQWRTPPFKALLRQWWRVVKARECGYDHSRLREAEGCLFGHAWLSYRNRNKEKTWAMQSGIRLRLSEWPEGRMQQWVNDPQVNHPEAGRGGMMIGSHLYLGYGPLTHKRNRGTVLQKPSSVEADEAAEFVIGFINQNEPELRDTLQLIHWFGTIGGRGRNGWGSVSLESLNDQNGFSLAPTDSILYGKAIKKLSKFSRPLADCLQLDWPHALGKDDKGLLIWRSRTNFDSWSQAMQELAQIKIAFRTKLDAPVGRAGDRHILAYPVTNHSVNRWLENGRDTNRLANQLRFKVIQDKNKRYCCLAYHLPCSLPEMLQQKLEPNRIGLDDQIRVWKQVHGILDNKMKGIQERIQGIRP